MRPHGDGDYPHKGGSEGHTEVEGHPHEVVEKATTEVEKKVFLIKLFLIFHVLNLWQFGRSKEGLGDHGSLPSRMAKSDTITYKM